MKKYYCYLARCSDNSLYTGYCADIESREQKHNEGKGSKYTKTHCPVKIIYWEEFKTRSAAMKREAQIKKLSKKEKETLLIS